MTTEEVALAVAAVATLISVLSALYARRISSIESDRRAEEVTASRVAAVSARLEAWGNQQTGRHSRLAIRNAGPAMAYDVTFATIDVDSARSPFSDVGLPIAELAAGEEFHGMAALAYGDPIPYRIELMWSDGRGKQRRVIPLTPQHIPG